MDSRTRHPGSLGLGGLRPVAHDPAAAVRRPNVGANFVDANGDGICDLNQSGNRQGQGGGKAQRGKRLGPQDGSGYGAPAGAGTGTGICDGTGPKGKGRGPRK